MIHLRNYQQQSVDEIRQAFTQGFKAPLLVSPTGSGKTICFAYISHGAAAKGNRIIILSHRQELIRQIGNALNEFSVPHGIIASGRRYEPHHTTQIASVQTLVNRLDTIQPPDLIIADECHHCTSPAYRKIFATWPAARRLGVSATPARLDGAGLGDIFDRMVNGPSVQTLIDQGFLSKPIYFAPPSGVDTSKLHIVAGDFNKAEAEALMDTPKITGDCVSHYTRICAGKPAIAFCTSIKHAQHVVEQFQARGYAAEMIDGKMDDKTRNDRTIALSAGRINVLVSVDVISEGYDVPVVSAAILLRPTASLALAMQQMGRVLRPAPGKTCAFIIDHVGNCLRHGLAEETREWSLDAVKRRAKKSDGPITQVKQCPKCYAVFAQAPWCPQCGFELPVKSRDIDQVEGELRQITAADIVARRSASWEANKELVQAKDRSALEALAVKRGYKPGWVDMMLRGRIGKRISGAPAITKMNGQPMQGLLL